jgi:hypothetical protein
MSLPESKCTHGVVFDEEAAKAVLGEWAPQSEVDLIAGNPRHAEVRKRWPRLNGTCPLGCGYVGIAYASWAHYTAGDW